MTMPRLGVLLVLLLGISSQAAPPSAIKGVVVLVPGTLNSVVPGNIYFRPVEGVIEANPYFSADALRSIEKQGYKVFVAKHLQWFGQYEANGAELLSEARDWYNANFPDHRTPVTLLGHSSGGFYALYAASVRSDLPIVRVIAVATPFLGAEIADDVFEAPAIGQKLERLCRANDSLIDLRGLPELSSRNVSQFLSRTRIPEGIAIHAVAGYQRAPSNPFEFLDARFLSPIYAFTDSLIGKPSDGMISVDSAYGRGAVILNDHGRSVPIDRLTDAQLPLEHAKQFLDYRIYELLLNRDAGFIHQEQVKFYSSILSRAERAEAH